MFFIDLVEKYLHEDLEAAEGCTPLQTKACAALKSSIRKKFIGATVQDVPSLDQLARTARDRFIANNDSCASTREFDHTRWRPEHPVRRILCRARYYLEEWLADLERRFYDPFEIGAAFAVGGGVAYGSDFNDLYSKAFAGPLYFHNAASLSLWIEVLRRSGLYPAEVIRREKHGHPKIRAHATWSSVRKNNVTDRSIVISNNGTALMSRAFGIRLEEVLAQLGLDIRSQPDRNRLLAMQGSIHEMFASEEEDMTDDWIPCTVDLSDASDLISVGHVRWFFESLPQIGKAISLLRDRYVLVDGEKLRLDINSTMGCGFTFPLQTLLFYALARGATDYALHPVYDWSDGSSQHYVNCVSVCAAFGDDIVVPKVAFKWLMSALKEIGMKPNPDKSFGAGPFRESCGTDWYQGYNIRGVYCKKLDHAGDTLTLLNQLVWWGSQWNIPLPRTISLLFKRLPGSARNRVPPWEDTQAGIRWWEPPLRQPSKRLVGPAPVEAWYRPWRPQKVERSLDIVNDAIPEMNVAWSTGIPSIDDKSWPDVRKFVFGREGSRAIRFQCENPAAYVQVVLGGGVVADKVGLRSEDPRHSQGKWEPAFSWRNPPVSLRTPYRAMDIVDTTLTDKLCQPGFPVDWSVRVSRFTTYTRSLPITPG